MIIVNPFLGKLLVKCNAYGGFSIYHISNIVTEGRGDQFLKQEALLDYIYQNVTPEVDPGTYPVIDQPPIELLIRGVGWCNQVSSLYVLMLEPLDIRGFGLVLTKVDGDRWVSPHTLAVVVPKGVSEEAYRQMHPNYGPYQIKGRTPSTPEGMNTGTVVDPSYGVLFKTPDNQPATLGDLCSQNIHSSQIKLIKNINKVHGQELFCNQVELCWANTPISEYKEWRGRICNYIYPILPKWAIHLFQDLVLLKVYSPLYKGPAYTYIKARNYHLYERFDEAIENYNEVIEKTSDKETVIASTFWKGMIYFRKKEFHKAGKIFESIIEDHPANPKIGFAIAAARWLKRVKMNQKIPSRPNKERLYYFELKFEGLL